MNSTQPSYPILIPNTSHVKIFILLVGGLQRVQELIFFLYVKIISTKICKKIHLLIFSKNSFRNELHEPFLPYFDTQHLICKKFNFVCRGVQGEKHYFVLGVPKVLYRGKT